MIIELKRSHLVTILQSTQEPGYHYMYVMQLLCVCVCVDRIPKDIMHSVPTTLLHSLEGMPGLEWKKLLKLQSQDGSFLFSPSSTAFALSQTKDKNCMEYLNKAVQRFEGGGKVL